MKTLDAAAVMARMDEGLPKLWLIHRALKLRSEHRDWFGPDAAYTPILAHGPKADHVIAYQRGENVITVVQRLSATLKGEWDHTHITLPTGTWLNRLTSESIEGKDVQLASLLGLFPVALLERVS